MSVSSRESYNPPHQKKKRNHYPNKTRYTQKPKRTPRPTPPRGSHLSTSKAQKKGKEGEKKNNVFAFSGNRTPVSFSRKEMGYHRGESNAEKSDLRKTGRATTAPRR